MAKSKAETEMNHVDLIYIAIVTVKEVYCNRYM